MFLSACLILGIASLSAIREFANPTGIDADILWSKLEAAIGAQKLRLTFASPQSLKSAVLAENQEATHIGCSVNYGFGTDLGKY